MKVAHLVCVIPPAGGMGTVALREVSGLRARGIEATVFAPESKEEKTAPPFVTQVPAAWHVGNAAWLKRIREQVKGYDILHIHWPFFGTGDRLMFRPAGLPPIVVTFHMDAEAHGWEALPIKAERALVQPILFSRVQKILVSSFDYAASSSIRGFLRKDAARFVELPFGVDLERYSPGPATRARFAVPEDAPVILFVGGLDKAHAFKGIGNLLEAFSQLDPSAHLLIVGDGDLRSSYEERARALGVERRTHFLGRIDDASVVDAYRSADVLAFPSVNRAEAFGLVPLEAQACGLPVVASDLPGLRKVVRQHETGLLVPPGSIPELSEALRAVLSDAVLRERLSQAALQHAKKFSWEAHLGALIDVYKQVCASPS